VNKGGPATPTTHKNTVIDYLGYDYRYATLMSKVWVDSEFDLGSDHLPVRMDVQVSALRESNSRAAGLVQRDIVEGEERYRWSVPLADYNPWSVLCENSLDGCVETMEQHASARDIESAWGVFRHEIEIEIDLRIRETELKQINNNITRACSIFAVLHTLEIQTAG